MKKVNILSIALVLILSSCSSDNSKPQALDDIVGTWEMIDYGYNGTTVTSAQGQTISTDFVAEAYDINYELTFEENPNNLSAEGSLSIEVTSTTLGQTTTQNSENLSVLEDGMWDILNNELVILTNGEESKMKIEKLTESSLILSIATEEDLSQAGISIISTINATIHLER